MNFEVMCIDDTNRPDGIPTSKWVKKGEIYTVIKVVFPHSQPGTIGFKLAELNIDDCFPYQYFLADRFAIIIYKEDKLGMWAEETLDKLLEEAKEEEDLKS